MYKVFKHGEKIDDIFIQEVSSNLMSSNSVKSVYRIDIDKQVSGMYWYEPKLFINVMMKVSRAYKAMSRLENENIY